MKWLESFGDDFAASQGNRGKLLGMTKRIASAFGILALVVVPVGLAVGSASASSVPSVGVPPSPDVPSCPPGYYYGETSHTQSQYGKGTALYLYNSNAQSADLSRSFSSQTTLNYAANVSGSAEINLIIFTIGTNDGITVGQSTTEGTDATATVNGVPAGEYGVIQLGDSYWNTGGTYYYESATCIESDESSVTARFPENPNSTLVLVGVSSSETTPWPQTD